MSGLKALGSLAVAAVASLSLEASAQDTVKWWDIACVHAKMSVPAGLRCKTTQNYASQSGWGGNAGGTFRQWQALGQVGGVLYFYGLEEATSLEASLAPTGALQDQIKAEMGTANAARNFSALVHRRGVDFMTFTAGSNDSCVALRRYGPSSGAEYKWILSALRCEPAGRPTTDADIDVFIAGATVRGPS